MPEIRLDAGEGTEQLLQYVLREIDDRTLDEIEVSRETAAADGLASEPITLVATLTLSATAILAVTRLIEKYLEQERQLKTIGLVADAFTKSTEAGKHLTKLARDNNRVSLKWGITKADARRKEST